MNWEPWNKYKEYGIGAIDIYDPPCRDCIFWHPQTKHFESNGVLVFDGVVCCHREEMEHDFSCYRKKL